MQCMPTKNVRQYFFGKGWLSLKNVEFHKYWIGLHACFDISYYNNNFKSCLNVLNFIFYENEIKFYIIISIDIQCTYWYKNDRPKNPFLMKLK